MERRRYAAGERISHVSHVVKQLVLDVAELHDVHQRRQQWRNQVPAARSTSVKRSTTVRQPQLVSRRL